MLLVGMGAFAQSNRQALGSKLYKGNKVALIDNNAEGIKPLKPTANGVMATSNGFSSSRNGFGMLVEECVPLSYNQDLNMVVFTQRIPPTTGTYAYATTGITTPTSGHMITNSTIDNGTTWVKASLYTASAVDVSGALARYPSGVIANATGNTDPASASFVGMGPCTDGSGWMANWFASRPANGTGNVMTGDQQVALSAIGSTGSVAENAYFASYSTTTRGTEVWTAGFQYAADGTTISGVRVYKGVKTGATYTWTSELNTALNDVFVSPDGSTYVSAPKIAWSSDGQTGYILVNGVYASATGNAQKAYQPNVWKTMDGGVNWAKINDNYDWKANHPYITGNLSLTGYDSDWNGSTFGNDNYPAFFESWGGEMTVDNTGMLHYVTAVSAGYSSHPDSLGYLFGKQGFSNVQNDNIDKPWVFDFMTSGSGWSTEFLNVLYTRALGTTETVGTNAYWTTDGSASLDYGNRIKVSRTTDGTKMFVCWAESDTTVIETITPTTGPAYQAHQPNKTPSLFYKAKDFTTGLWSPTSEAVYFDAVENAFYLHQTSEIVMPSACGYTIPTIYISSSDGSQNATNAIDYNYITDLEICNNTYTNPAGITNGVPFNQTYWIVGVKENKTESISGVSQNFPNPFTGTTAFNVNLKKSEVITVNVTTTIGQVVATKVVKGTTGINEITIDATNLESGIYFYTVVAGDSKVTRKMSIVK